MIKLENKNIIEIICNDNDEVFKQKIKELLITICYGKEQEELEIISFDETIEELIKRLEKKTSNQKAGMIGELLFHLKSFDVLKEYKHISVYLNREERNVKKGFDVLLFDGNNVWYTEVKSRENAKKEDITQAHVAKLKEAINDVKNKFSCENKNYWLTAKSNIVNVDGNQLKKQIANILTKEMSNDVEKNAIGVSAVFKENISNIEESEVQKVIEQEKEYFKNLAVICISHEDYNKVINILKEIKDGINI